MSINLRVSQVTLTDHPEPHRRVHSIHGLAGQGEWRHTQEQAIGHIENHLFNYHLLHDDRAIRLVVGQTATGEKFLKAQTDGHLPTLLLQLPVVLPAPAAPPPASDRLVPLSLDNISTLVDHQRDGRFIVAFCPVCDRMEEVAEAGRSRADATAECIAKIRLHINRAHRPKLRPGMIPLPDRRPSPALNRANP
jgi:hypothetical protein